MHRYIIRRLLLAVPVLFVVMLILFVTTRALPGDYALQQLASSPFTPNDVEALREILGTNKPVIEQFLPWMWDALRFDVGNSFQTNQSVWKDLGPKVEPTLELSLAGMIVALGLALPIGILSALYQDSVLDYVLRVFAIFGLAVPVFVTAVLLILIPSRLFDYAAPASWVSFTDDPIGNLEIIWRPALIGGIAGGAGIMRLMRSQMLEVLRQDYIRTAWSKGLRERTVVVRHALKNAMLPIFTIMGLIIANLFSGNVILEQMFNIPGMGQYTLRAIYIRDFPVVQTVVLVLASFLIVVNLLTDLMYSFIDPRIRYG